MASPRTFYFNFARCRLKVEIFLFGFQGLVGEIGREEMRLSLFRGGVRVERRDLVTAHTKLKMYNKKHQSNIFFINNNLNRPHNGCINQSCVTKI